MTNKVKVLVFDDDELIGQTIKNIGEHYSLEVSYTPYLEEFWQLLDNDDHDFIILDLLMPQCDGVQVASDLAKIGVSSKIIIMSGVNSRVLEAAARSASAQKLNVVGVLQKPFSPKQFRKILDFQPSAQADTLSPAGGEGSPSEVSNNNAIFDRLKKAISEEKIEFALQPKIDCRTAHVSGFEVLARWFDEELGFVAPDIFIRVAEEHELINELTFSVCHKAIAWFSEFHRVQKATNKEVIDGVSLSINLSYASLALENLVDTIETICQSHHISPSHITLELTETAAMVDPIGTLDRLTRLRMKGFNLSIDDFGTGYSSMLQLVRLPFSELKIDKSFTLTALESRESKVVIKAMVELAHSLGIKIVAEGVESDEVFDFLNKLGCDEAQGYLIAKPMPPPDVQQWLQSRQIHREKLRVKTLQSYDILDTPNEHRYDRVTRLASRLFKLPICVVSFVDEHRQWFKATTGTSLKETCRTEAFCHHTIQKDEVLIIHDTLNDVRFAENELVMKTPFIRFYAGYPIYSPEHEVLGAFCVMDIQPREFNQHDISMLKDFAAMVEKEIAMTADLSEDFLTGLLNRKTFENRLTELNEFCQKEALSLSMLYLDIDDFKTINDDFGHKVGDQLLTLFADTLMESFRNSDLVARLGGDEFVVAMVNDATFNINETLSRLDEALLCACKEANLPQVQYSSGLSVSTNQVPMTTQQLYEKADLAMYKRKNIKKR